MSYIEAAQWNAMKQKAYEYDRMEERAKKAEAEVERLKAQIKRLYERGQSLEAELERYNGISALKGRWVPLTPSGGLVFHHPQATVGPLMSEHCHYWGCPAVTTPGAACDCGAGKEGGA